MKIVDLRSCLVGGGCVVRIVTDTEISGYSQIESAKSFLQPAVSIFKDLLLDENPIQVERIMQKIRQRGGTKPWGALVSAIEVALWDIAGKAANLPVHRLLGGSVRDRVRVYNTYYPREKSGIGPEGYAKACREIIEQDEGFTIIKRGIGLHGLMRKMVPNLYYGEVTGRGTHGYVDRGLFTEFGINYIVECVDAMKGVLGDRVGLALDCGPGFTVSDALRLARAVERYNILWLEDLLTGDFSPNMDVEAYEALTRASPVATHTGEQCYLRGSLRQLIERKAISIVGPDPLDCGGMAELKWIAEFADMHGVMMAPHGVYDGIFGIAALVHSSCTMPSNFIAFEYPTSFPDYWYDITEGLERGHVKDGHIAVWDRPGLGIEFVPAQARKHVDPHDDQFFD